MVSTRRQAIERSALADAYPVGYCARWVRTMYGVDPSGDADRDGDVDAADSWKRATHKHANDRFPPPGVPVYWSGGRSGHGHIAISWAGGRIRGTDSPNAGHVGTVDLEWVEKNWGLKYVGWSEDIHGALIPVDAVPLPKKQRPADVRAAIKNLTNRLLTAGPVEARRIREVIAKLRKINKR